VAGLGSTSAASTKAFSLEPYSYAEARAIAEALEIAEPVAVTLVRRGYRTVAEARRFLEAADDHDPFEFDSMAGITARLLAAVEAGTRITVHGDYDVDGVCSTAILVRSLREMGADCDWYIPDRMGDGYGVTVAGVEALAARGTGVLVTVDCGISSASEVEAAHRAGLEVIVTDHHEPPELLPDCPILHPALSDYPCAELCATGVAYKLAAALRGADAVARECDLVALATVADLVPLRGENRALVRRGLAEARRARRPGLRALMAAAGVGPERLDEGDVAFRLAPRINAVGRLYRADAGVELMLTTDEARATAIAAELESANRERRQVESDVLAAAERALRELPGELADGAGLVIAGEGWHPGVVGIVASRLVERHWRPVVLIGLDGEGKGRGSGRSVPGFDLLDALRACDEHLLRFGGHRAAAGVEISADRINAFREAFVRHAGEVAGQDPVRTEPVDAVVGGESLGHDVAEQLQRLGPFGLGNPAVNWLVPSATLTDVRPMGEGERHVRFSLRSGPRRALGVAFGANGEVSSAADEPCDVSVRLELNEWNGAVEPRVVLGDLYDPEPPEDDRGSAADPGEIGEREFWDRLEAERAVDLADWPPRHLAADGPDPAHRRELVDRRGTSGIAAVAALASSGETVLVLCADALRRRALVERAARPARFGGGEVAVLSRRLSVEFCEAGFARLRAAGAGVALADWPVLAARPEIVGGFVHVVVVDPAPFAHLDALARAGEGYLHLLCGPAETEHALRALAEEWPNRETLAWHFRALRRRAKGGALEHSAAHATLSGAGHPYPRAPEVAARVVRVLEELGLATWHGSGAEGALGVVSSEGIDLGRSPAFLAYGGRLEEGKRWLSEPEQNL
jgi:single-stranded-DNA-specific exonuclease